MKEDANHIHQYSGDDIRQYLDGKLSPEAMHQMEKAALSDPFLADAIAGMELHAEQGQSSYGADLAELNTRLSNKITGDKRTKWVWWKVAAVLLPVIGAVALTFFLTNKKIQPPIVASQTVTRKINPAPPPASADTMPAAGAVLPSGKSTSSASHRRYSIKKPDEHAVPPVQEPEVTADAHAEAQTRVDGVVGQPPETHPVDSTAPVAASSDGETLSKSLQGKAAGVDIDTLGVPLDEVVVIGYGVRKKRVAPGLRATNKTMHDFVPDGGWIQFEEYVERHKMDSLKPAAEHGKETVEFSVGDDKRPEQIAVIHSISGEHDAAVIRMLRTGPDWTEKKARKRRLRLSVLY
jgi:hypothetical protein